MNKNAKWIICPKKEINTPLTFTRSFSPKRKIKQACIKVSSLGNYALFVNGERIGKGVLTPGWTSYDHRVQYQTVDITEQIKENNTITIGAGPGWAVGAANYHHETKLYAERVCVADIPNINKAKRAIKKAFEKQMNNEGFTFIEVLSTCPTNWGMTPLKANEWLKENMIPYYPLGVIKDKSAEV